MGDKYPSSLVSQAGHRESHLYNLPEGPPHSGTPRLNASFIGVPLLSRPRSPLLFCFLDHLPDKVLTPKSLPQGLLLEEARLRMSSGWPALGVSKESNENPGDPPGGREGGQALRQPWRTTAQDGRFWSGGAAQPKDLPRVQTQPQWQKDEESGVLLCAGVGLTSG